MAETALSIDETRKMFLHVSMRMVESKDLLTQADKAVGDGDHGVGMARGFEAVAEKLKDGTFTALDELVETVGATLMTSVGGAAGAVFGTWFRGGAKGLSGSAVFDSAALSLLLVDGLAAVKQRGQAKPGDKTMVDALEPAALRSKELTTLSLGDALVAVAEAAGQGMEKTKELIAKAGKAKTLGERSLGHADPGAVSTHLILKFMAEYVSIERKKTG